MPRFFFNVVLNGDRTIDTGGMDLPDLDAARQKAIEATRQVISERDHLPELNGAFLISDVSGKPILTVDFAEAFAALNQDRPRNGARSR